MKCYFWRVFKNNLRKWNDRWSAPLPTIQYATWPVHRKVRELHLNPRVHMNFPAFQDGAYTEPELQTGTIGTVLPGTEIRTGTVRTFLHEPTPNRNLPSPWTFWNAQDPFTRGPSEPKTGTAGTVPCANNNRTETGPLWPIQTEKKKTGSLVLRPRKLTKMAGITYAKRTLFAKNTVLITPEIQLDKILRKGIFDLFLSADQHINFISPQNADYGDLKIGNRDGPRHSGNSGFLWSFPWNPMSREFREIHSGDPVLVFWGNFWGKWEWPKLIMLGRGDFFLGVQKLTRSGLRGVSERGVFERQICLFRGF